MLIAIRVNIAIGDVNGIYEQISIGNYVGDTVQDAADKLKKEKIERMISVLEDAEKGELEMNKIDNSYEKTRKQYETEVKEKWGSTDAYKESQQKTSAYSKEKWNDVTSGLDEVIAEFAKAKADGKTARP